MYAKSTRPSAKREVQKDRSAQRDDRVLRSAMRDDQIARPRRAQACERSARWECAREAGRFFHLKSTKFTNLYVKDIDYRGHAQSPYISNRSPLARSNLRPKRFKNVPTKRVDFFSWSF